MQLEPLKMRSPHGCFLPLNAIAVHPQGFRQFCLTSTLAIDADPEVYTQQRIDIHNQLLRGEWPDSCRFCKNKEKRDVQSRRTRTWERKRARYGAEQSFDMIKDQTAPRIRHLEISFSNVCNLQCAMCSSEFSTSWVKADAQAVEEGLEFRDFTKPFQKVARISEALLDEVLAHAEYFDLVIIKGGEPTREPSCLKFIKRLAQLRAGHSPRVFIQSNGTRPAQEWLPEFRGLDLEVGFSLDGWGPTYEWIRGTAFEPVLQNFLYLDEQPDVLAMSVDFTLSSFNCFHLPEFFQQILDLKARMRKFNLCPVFQWVQQPYASPLNLKEEDRIRIREQVRPLLESDPGLFMNSENLLRVLSLPRPAENLRKTALQWHDYMNRLRDVSIYDLEPRLYDSLR